MSITPICMDCGDGFIPVIPESVRDDGYVCSECLELRRCAEGSGEE